MGQSMPLEGLSVPVPTLFAADGALDPGRNAKFARALSEAKVDHLFVLGSLGEFPSVTDEERPRLLDVVIESVTGRTDVWVGVGAPSTRQALHYADEAEGAGAAALVAVPPYYLHPPPAWVERYYRSIAAAASLPLLAYNIPSLVGYALAPDLVHRLARDGVIAGLKDTAGSLASVAAFLDGAPEGFPVFPGDDAFAGPAIERGARGAVMGMANLVPRLCVRLVRAALDHDRATVAELQPIVDALVDVSRAGPFPSVDKFLAARLWGADVGYRAPYDPLSPTEEAAVVARLAPLEPRLAPFLGK
jgi:4-hydroxy-tetrahydrodipicolinate synthase